MYIPPDLLTVLYEERVNDLRAASARHRILRDAGRQRPATGTGCPDGMRYRRTVFAPWSKRAC